MKCWKISPCVLCVGIMVFFPQLLHWSFTYLIYLIADFYLVIYVLKKCKKNELISPVLFLSVLMILMNAYNLPYNQKYGNFITGLLCAIFIYCLERVIYIQKRDNMLDAFLKKICKISVWANFLNCISVLVLWQHRDSSLTIYFLGPKFMSSFLFLFGVLLYYICQKRNGILNKTKLIIWIIGSMIFDYTVGCMSALIVSFIVLVLFVFSLQCVKKVLGNQIVLLAAIVITGTFPFWSYIALNNLNIQYLIVNVFHKNLSLTGRLAIYEYIPRIIEARILTGYGYGTRIVEKTVGYGNIQNGLLSIFVQYGAIITILFVLICIQYLKNYKYANKRDNVFLYMTYGMIAISTIEISYDGFLFFFIIFLTKYLQDYMPKKF